MFNLNKSKSAQITIEEKMLRKDPIGPDTDKRQFEKKLPHRDGYENVTTESQMDRKSQSDVQIIEKVLNDAEGYITHRSDAGDLPIPPINVLVEKLRQDRISKDWEVIKQKHWSQADDKAQQGDLPKLKGNVPQHDKSVLNNDPQRFSGETTMPIHTDQSKNDKGHGKKQTIKPLIGGITTAEIDVVADKIKTGESIDYDTAIVAILHQSDKEKRELTDVERRAIVDLKIARTKALLSK